MLGQLLLLVHAFGASFLVAAVAEILNKAGPGDNTHPISRAVPKFLTCQIAASIWQFKNSPNQVQHPWRSQAMSTKYLLYSACHLAASKF